MLLFRALERTLKTLEAATLLDVSPNTLRTWERRFGYPSPQRTPGRHSLYGHGEIAALRDALEEGLSIAVAITRAQEALRADTHVLVGALHSFELNRAEAAMEATLALRSVERSVEEVLLASLDELAARHGIGSAPWAFAARWATDWLHRAQRLAPTPTRAGVVVIGDASRDELDPDDLYLQALELFLLRAGMGVLSLPVTGVRGLGDVLGAVRPDAVVIAGSHEPDDAVARWAHQVRAVAGALPIALYRRASTFDRVRTTGAVRLDERPGDAHRQLLTAIENRGSVVEVGHRPEPDASVSRSVLVAGSSAS